eukprot:TRINITY_DN4829_c0_g1_i3.p2 TRINITY_DN4829_c0_g1~~TRINITY_DN4829_c0_g1_i3.p2  ORF type:complete len:206 (-),score=91.54 TRINITY_DN4829_c0_g1_i3:98-715(-)
MLSTIQSKQGDKTNNPYVPPAKRRKLDADDDDLEGDEDMLEALKSMKDDDDMMGDDMMDGMDDGMLDMEGDLEDGDDDNDEDEAPKEASGNEYYEHIKKLSAQKKLNRAEKTKQITEERNKLPEFDEEDETIEGKRKVDRKIEKNIGLKRKTKKQDRNPRVKHKRRYAKALIKRKSQVQPLKDKSKKYAGEATGIKANVVKSVSL